MGRSAREPRRPSGRWWERDRDRLRFERAVGIVPGLRSRLVSGRGTDAGRVYVVVLHIPGYNSRLVTIRFRKRSPSTARVCVDGPTGSPHRYEDGSLCMWHPSAPPDERWLVEDGLHALLGYVSAHLFREAWWRETDEWLGPEAPHTPEPKKSLSLEDAA